MRTRIKVLFMVCLLTIACSKKGDSDSVTDRQKKPNQEMTKPKPPGVAIHIAALQGHIDAIHQHIKAGTNLDKKDVYGSTPLITAITFGKTDVVKALINAGASLQIANNDGSTPLHVAAFLCRTQALKALLVKGADKTAKNKTGATALMSVAGPFEEVEEIYDAIGSALKPLGLRLDYERLRKTRPLIAQLLQ